MTPSLDSSKFDYRLLLLKELQQIQKRNRSFSLTALARMLNVSAGYLSQVFSGKRVLSETTALKFAKKLKWETKKRNLFLVLVRYQRAGSEDAKKLVLKELESLPELDFLELEVNHFEVISQWYHFAILELTQLQDFTADPAWIARRLQITQTQASAAIARLLKLGLLVDQSGTLKKTKVFYRKHDVPSAAGRTFLETNLDKAHRALQIQPFEARDFSGTTVAINRQDLPEVKELIREFRNKLNAFCADSTNPDTVYQLAVQFFRLDQEIQ